MTFGWSVSRNVPHAKAFRELSDMEAFSLAREIADSEGEAVIEGGEPKRMFVLRRVLTEDYE